MGLLGFGVVGRVWKNIEKNRQALELRLGVQLEIAEVVVRDLSRERSVSVPEERLSQDPERIVGNPAIDIVCELMGGVGAAWNLPVEP